MAEHYNKIGRYLEALTQANPLSHFKVFTDPMIKSFPPTFQRFFVCFKGLKDGWLSGGRSVLCVDGYFIKTFLGGMLLSAIGRDSNDQMYPVAWAVVEGENNSSWEWFFCELKKNLGSTDGVDMTFISDEHQSILRGVHKVFPMAEHRHCARHVFANWHKSHKGDELKMLFWKAAKAYNGADLEEALDEMSKVNPVAASPFRSCTPNLFCRAFVRTSSKCDVIVSNMAETFNSYIINARTKHLIFMLEDIRGALMQRMVVKRQQMEKIVGVICPRIKARLEKEKDQAAYCTPLPSSEVLFEVCHRLDSLTVNLEARTCTCRKWDLSGIPCCHAIACIFFKNDAPENYVHECYTKEAYLRMYSTGIAPLTGERHWPKVDVPLDPPPIKIGRGRPRKNRMKSPHENPKKPGKLTKHGVEMSCSVCQSKNHNKRTCPEKNKAIEPPVKRMRGRPKKVIQPAQTQSDNNQNNAQPSRLGRGGRLIHARGRGVGGKGARGRGRGDIPVGFGVIIDGNGNTWTNSPRQHGGPTNISEASAAGSS
ncbi:unnamed protein product [Cuscuta epithymum]|uniref:SWIM-type domain-containing protein n=1 Tax=Cuscuta epithymum TaxID=186058 RepID=A0AAV0FAQ7_9ASTE|nr:unnamed protein product [Cuscuta epithymum]